ncbi:cytochrome b/b6 domain-containing protein [Streptomyces sp. NK08204]|uniref:cytochrome b/b6 domain-containing protein n=1 Tax=Streptomyces sp. NK08204 TaxID=2873260 RepID=UPI001CEC2FE6|nr:cytochrome b/b6 domain-containing protein [Streptomyces sp. NK08204]
MNRRRSTSSLPKPGRSAYGAATAVTSLLLPVTVLAGGSRFRDFLNFGAGVMSLVSLSCSVIWGLFAQDRIFLNARQRIVGQAVHRTTGIASIAFLLLHITIKVSLGHTRLIAAVVPFSLGVTGIAGLIGLGSLAGLLMIFVGVTGALRSNFATPAPVAARWRAMHMLAYPAWCAALVHGLYAGRQAKPVFVILYILSLLGVMGALALRSAPRPVKRRIADRLAALFGSPERPGPDDLDAVRARGSALPGYEGRPERRPSPAGSTGPLFASPYPSPVPAPEPVSGFAAAYRAVSTAGRAGGPSGSSGSWPIPSPPPVGEAAPSAYDPVRDTGRAMPVYDGPGVPVYDGLGVGGYGGSDPYDTGETNGRHGTYHPGDTFNGGPATETLPGAPFGAPGSGEPWNTPSGGFE